MDAYQLRKELEVMRKEERAIKERIAEFETAALLNAQRRKENNKNLSKKERLGRINHLHSERQKMWDRINRESDVIDQRIAKKKMALEQKYEGMLRELNRQVASLEEVKEANRSSGEEKNETYYRPQLDALQDEPDNFTEIKYPPTYDKYRAKLMKIETSIASHERLCNFVMTGAWTTAEPVTPTTSTPSSKPVVKKPCKVAKKATAETPAEISDQGMMPPVRAVALVEAPTRRVIKVKKTTEKLHPLQVPEEVFRAMTMEEKEAHLDKLRANRHLFQD